jgi:hypothetical protein
VDKHSSLFDRKVSDEEKSFTTLMTRQVLENSGKKQLLILGNARSFCQLPFTIRVGAPCLQILDYAEMAHIIPFRVKYDKSEKGGKFAPIFRWIAWRAERTFHCDHKYQPRPLRRTSRHSA